MAIEIEEFAAGIPPATSEPQRAYPFGLSNERIATALRKIARRVQSTEVTLQKIEMTQTAVFDEFVTKRIVIEYTEQLLIRPRPPRKAKPALQGAAQGGSGESYPEASDAGNSNGDPRE